MYVYIQMVSIGNSNVLTPKLDVKVDLVHKIYQFLFKIHYQDQQPAVTIFRYLPAGQVETKIDSPPSILHLTSHKGPRTFLVLS